MAKSIASLLGDSPGGLSEKEEAAKDFIDAVTSKDAKATAIAFAALYELCASEHDSEEVEVSDDEETYEG